MGTKIQNCARSQENLSPGFATSLRYASYKEYKKCACSEFSYNTLQRANKNSDDFADAQAGLRLCY